MLWKYKVEIIVLSLYLRCTGVLYDVHTTLYIHSNYNTQIQIDSAYYWKTVDYLGTTVVKCSLTELSTDSRILMDKDTMTW